jgi:hypothetical protein
MDCDFCIAASALGPLRADLSESDRFRVGEQPDRSSFSASGFGPQ